MRPGRFLNNLLRLSVAAVLLGACSQPVATSIPPTPLPSLTPVATQTQNPLPLPSPFPKATGIVTSTPTSLPTPTLEPPIPLPTGTWTPESVNPPRLVQREIRILQPGSLSKLASPFTLEASAIPGDKGAIHIELIGEDGRPLFSKVNGYAAPAGQRVGFAQEIVFEIPGVSELARLQVSVSDVYGRITSLSSVQLILLSIGESDVNTPVDQYSPYILTTPVKNQSVSGGKLQVSGFARPVNDQTIRMDLLGRQGEIYGSRLVSLPIPENGLYTPFSTDVPYTISAATWALLVIHQSDNRIPGDAALLSVAVLLQP